VNFAGRVLSRRFLRDGPRAALVLADGEERDVAERAELTEALSGAATETVPVCAKIELEIAELPPEDCAAFLEDLGLADSGLARVIRARPESANPRSSRNAAQSSGGSSAISSSIFAHTGTVSVAAPDSASVSSARSATSLSSPSARTSAARGPSLKKRRLRTRPAKFTAISLGGSSVPKLCHTRH
jgi:hypothetical protein